MMRVAELEKQLLREKELEKASRYQVTWGRGPWALGPGDLAFHP